MTVEFLRLVPGLAEAMGMKLVFYGHTDRLRHGYTEPIERLQALLAQSDIVSLHAPETQATSGMIGEAELRQMKDRQRGGLCRARCRSG